jgi:DDE superfamily endonuclease
MKKVFEPLTAKRNTSGRHRLLILDGHNSHCSYAFCAYAEVHDIIILCLPPHTTHALQPCDVGVFGPLASSWAAVVNEISRLHQAVTKQSFLKHYSEARRRAMQPSTIRNAFEKCGIYPTNRAAIPESSFAPALNTSTEAPSAVPLDFPSILETIPEDAETLSAHSSASNQASSNSIQNSELIAYDMDGTVTPPLSAASTLSFTSTSSAASTTSAASQLSLHSNTSTLTSSSSPRYRIAGIPPPLKHTASRQELRARITLLTGVLGEAEAEMSRQKAQLVLLQAENAALRRAMEMRKPKRKIHSSEEAAKARVLTDHESLVLLGRAVYRKVIEGDIMKAKMKERRKRVEEDISAVIERMKEEEKARKVAERAAEKDRKAREAEVIKQIRLEERQRKKLLAAEAKRAKEQAAAEKKAARALAKAQAAEAKRREKAQASRRADGGDGSDEYDDVVDGTDVVEPEEDLASAWEDMVQTETGSVSELTSGSEITPNHPNPPGTSSQSYAYTSAKATSSPSLQSPSICTGSNRSTGSCC